MNPVVRHEYPDTIHVIYNYVLILHIALGKHDDNESIEKFYVIENILFLFSVWRMGRRVANPCGLFKSPSQCILVWAVL